MNRGKIGLVLEGGGMRGAYTAGVLDVFKNKSIDFPYIIAVSAGANNGSDFVADQSERNKKVLVDYVTDDRYMGFKNLIKTGNFFGMDFLFEELPNRIEPFDYESFREAESTFKVGVTECQTGNTVYFENKNFDPHFFMEKVLRASSSLPIVAKPVEINGKLYLDGGITDPIPISKSIEDGNYYNVLVLTRDKDYRKSSSLIKNILSKVFLYKYPQIVKAMKNRHRVYNNTLEKIEELELEKRVFVFRPQKELNIDRFENDQSMLNNIYNRGYEETLDLFEDFQEWLAEINYLHTDTG